MLFQSQYWTVPSVLLYSFQLWSRPGHHWPKEDWPEYQGSTSSPCRMGGTQALSLAPKHRLPPHFGEKKTWATFRITVNCDAPSIILVHFSEPCMYVSTSSITFSCIKIQDALMLSSLFSPIVCSKKLNTCKPHDNGLLVLAGILQEMHPTSISGLPVWKGWPRWRGHRPVRGGYYGLRCSH